jgi:hypothetical protein
MADGDGLLGDDQYQIGSGSVIGIAPLLLGEVGVSGWDGQPVKSNDVDLDMADGSVGGWDGLASLDITIPAVIVDEDETAARAILATLQSDWAPTGWSDRQLHRQVDNAHEYVVGRTRGMTVEMRFVKSGVIPVLLAFRANDPTIHAVVAP